MDLKREGYTMDEVVLPLRVLHLMGTDTCILTNAAGAIHPAYHTDSPMIDNRNGGQRLTEFQDPDQWTAGQPCTMKREGGTGNWRCAVPVSFCPGPWGDCNFTDKGLTPLGL